MIERAIIAAGQPHFYLAADRNPGWASLKRSYEGLAAEIARSDAELMLVYSTQWFSVIGHLFQTDPNPEWTLVDQNWYEYGEIPYSFRVDEDFGKLYAATAKDMGMQAATVNYHGFPIDTGTVVALKLLNPDNRIPVSIVSCNIYAEREETRMLGFAGRRALEASGKKAIVVCVTNLSNRYHTSDIEPARDRVSSQKDDEWNRKILEILSEGRLEDTAQVAREFAREANADMNFKAIWWLAALAGENNLYDGRVLDYQPVWGTGAALVELVPNPRKDIDFEKEFDDVPVESVVGGTGLETHNVIDTPGGAPTPSSGVSAMSSQPAPAAQGGAAEDRTPSGATVRSARAASPVGPYPHARRVGDLIYLSGMGPRRPGVEGIPGVIRDDAGKVIAHDIEVQTRAVFENIRVILEEAGSSLDKVVDVTVFLTDMERDFSEFNRVYGEIMGTIQPTRTTVGVDSLPTPIAVELKVVALA